MIQITGEGNRRLDMLDLLLAARPELDISETTSLGRSDLVEDLLDGNPRLGHAWSGGRTYGAALQGSRVQLRRA